MYNLYESKIKMVPEQFQLTIVSTVFIGLLHEDCYLVGGNEPLVREGTKFW